MYVKLNREMVYLWRAVDHEGEILETYLTKTRDKSAALTFLKKAPKRHGGGADHHRRPALLSRGETYRSLAVI